MKFIINDNKLKIEFSDTINSGSFRDYLMEVETDESWQGLSIEAIISKKDSNEGIARAVINNEVYIDMPKKERYTIGFIGYTIENNQKIHQKSTDLKIIPIVKGAGEIEATNTEEIPTESEWEIYLAQVQEFINNGNEIINQANNLDLDITKNGRIATVTITKKDNTEKSEDIEDGVGLDYNWQGTSLGIKKETEQEYQYVDLKGDCNFATFEVNNNMELVMNKTEDMLLDFSLSEDGILSVVI